MKRRPFWIALVLLACAGRSDPQPLLRVGTSGDYAPFSQQEPGGRRKGFDVALARAYARDRGLAIRWVTVHWDTLDRDFAAGRFDIVMSGVTVRPERSAAGRFSLPVATSGAVLLTRAASDPLPAGARIVVNAGGHLERVARHLFPAESLRPLAPNSAVRKALLSGAADAAVTDTLEAASWLEGTSGLRVIGPFTRDWKAYWLPARASERARDLDGWLLAQEADGRLATLRARYLPEPACVPSATALVALGAALEERLSLMPLVAEAKRATGTPIRVPAQEQAVLDAALASVRQAATRDGLAQPPDTVVRDFFVASIDAAREVQEATLSGPPKTADAAPLPLEQVLRPALARISERIAWLLVRLPVAVDESAVKDALEPLRQAGVTAATQARISRALQSLRAH